MTANSQRLCPTVDTDLDSDAELLAVAPPSAGSKRSPAVTRCLRDAGLLGMHAGTAGVRGGLIAFIDGAADLTHPCLQRSQVALLPQIRTPSAAATEHATFIASMLSGEGPDCLGLVPSCPVLNIGAVDAEILGASASPKERAGRLGDAVALAVERGARIIQMSLDFAFDGMEVPPLSIRIQAAVDRGAVVELAAGHRPTVTPNPLLAMPGVVPVRAAALSEDVCIPPPTPSPFGALASRRPHGGFRAPSRAVWERVAARASPPAS